MSIIPTNILRIVQKHITHFKKTLIFKFSHISFGGKISLSGSSIILLSLLFPWASSGGDFVDSGNIVAQKFGAFSAVMGYIGAFILLGLIIVVFSICSINKKQKIRYLSSLEFHTGNICVIVAIGVILGSLHCFLLTLGLKLFSSNIIYSNGIIIAMTGAIILCIGGIVNKKEYRMNIKGSYINDTPHKPSFSENKEEKDNMKLPF